MLMTTRQIYQSTIKTVNAYPKPIIPGDAYLYKGGAVVDKIRTILCP